MAELGKNKRPAYNVSIRIIRKGDIKSIVSLNNELGYDTDYQTVKSQLNSIRHNKDHIVFIAEFEGIVVGYIHASKTARLTSAPFYEINALVVNEIFRRKGIGKFLISQLERQINSSESIRVRCHKNRIYAHKFYTHLGFTEIKVQKVFTKTSQST